MTEGATALGVWLAFRNALSVEIRHLLDQVVIVQQDGSVWAHGERVLIALDWNTRIRRRSVGPRLCHCHSSS
jgi:hypothetical protein